MWVKREHHTVAHVSVGVVIPSISEDAMKGAIGKSEVGPPTHVLRGIPLDHRLRSASSHWLQARKEVGVWGWGGYTFEQPHSCLKRAPYELHMYQCKPPCQLSWPRFFLQPLPPVGLVEGEPECWPSQLIPAPLRPWQFGRPRQFSSPSPPVSKPPP
jgi:hypothetical protein